MPRARHRGATSRSGKDSMSGHNDPGPGDGTGSVPEQPSRMSRRNVLRGAAGAGAVGLAAAAGAGAVAAAAHPATAKPGAAGPAALPSHHDPVVVYLRDASSGELDVFTGTSQVRFRDRALAARLLTAVRQEPFSKRG